MKKKNKSEEEKPDFDPELLRMYLMGATNPGISNKITIADDSIDLHIESLHKSRPGIPPQDALFVQLEKFEHALDRAVAAGKLEFRVVHGLGKGKLKEEIYKILKKHPHVRSYTNDYHSRYGFGSTLIYLQ
jgi:DNA-nicking Smr family endonuclease